MKAQFSSAVFSERLKAARIKAALSQKGLSEQSGVSPLSISGYESSTKTPNLSSAYALASALNVSLDWICGLNEENIQEPSTPTTRDYLLFTTRLIDTITNESFLKLAEENLTSGTPIYDFIIDYLKFKDMVKNWNTNIEIINETLNHLFQDFELYSVESLLTAY